MDEELKNLNELSRQEITTAVQIFVGIYAGVYNTERPAR